MRNLEARWFLEQLGQSPAATQDREAQDHLQHLSVGERKDVGAKISCGLCDYQKMSFRITRGHMSLSGGSALGGGR